MKLSSKHQETLRAVLEDPARSDIEWPAIEDLLLALGAELTEGHGSKVRLYLEGVRAVFHRPLFRANAQAHWDFVQRQRSKMSGAAVC